MLALLKLFVQARRVAIVALLLSIATGVSTALMIGAINRALQRSDISSALVLGFAGTCAFTILARLGSQFLLIRIAQQAMIDLRSSLCRKIATTPLRTLETMGFARLMPILTDDVNAVADAVAVVPLIIANAAILVACAAYLAWVSPVDCVLAVVLLAIGQSIPWVLRRRGRQYLDLARREQITTYERITGLIQGNKEIKLNAQRCEAFLETSLRTSLDAFRVHDTRRRFLETSGWTMSKLMGLLVVGALLFLPIDWDMPTRITFITTVLFMVGAFDVLQNQLPTVSRAETGLAHIQTLETTLASLPPPAVRQLPRSFERITLEGVTHAYMTEQASSFVLGPIDLDFRKGELVFLVGGNGSGKSTFAKLLTGLYVPEQGAIRVDGELVDASNRDAFRQLFSAVFADFYVFDTIHGVDAATLAQAATYLAKLKMDHKVRLEDGVFSTTALSSGQRKRLALLVAYLEDRPFYVFDEWAADQDPTFKDVFYRQLLPELRDRGKTVLVISHDDKYFDAGDRIIQLDYGRLVVTHTGRALAG